MSMGTGLGPVKLDGSHYRYCYRFVVIGWSSLSIGRRCAGRSVLETFPKYTMGVFDVHSFGTILPCLPVEECRNVRSAV